MVKIVKEMNKVTVAVAGLLFVVIALNTPFASATDVINQNIATRAVANSGHITVNASNVANAGPGSIVNQTISQVVLSKYSDYFRVPSAPSTSPESKTKTHIETPEKYDLKNKIPTTVYFNYQMQAVPYSQYQTLPTYMGGNSLWIQGTTSWTRYAQVPLGSSLSLLATSSTGGNGYLYEIIPGGTLSKNSLHFFPASSQIGFYANTTGQHILLFVIDDQVSNSVVVNVVPNIQPYQSSVPGIPYP